MHTTSAPNPFQALWKIILLSAAFAIVFSAMGCATTEEVRKEPVPAETKRDTLDGLPPMDSLGVR